jgi:uncharacterized membrane protein YphA (DoxX/SURF4 family)
MATSRRDQVAFLIGRIAVGGMYASAGIANLFDLEAKAAYVASKGVFEPKCWSSLPACCSWPVGLVS